MSTPTQLTIEETQHVIEDFTSLVSGPEPGVACVSQLLARAKRLRAFLAEKGYPTSEYDIETRYKYSS